MSLLPRRLAGVGGRYAGIWRPIRRSTGRFLSCAGWFRQAATESDPGSTRITLSGAVAVPGVYGVARGASWADLLAVAPVIEERQAVLLGGYFSSWVAAELTPCSLVPRATALALMLQREDV